MTNINPDPKLSRLLDDLAAAERASAPADLEQRVVEATRAHLAGRPAEVAGRVGLWRTPAIRTAAALALVAGAAIVTVVATRPAPAPPSALAGTTDALIRDIDQDIDAWLAAGVIEPADLDGALASLEAELADAEVVMLDFWTLDDPFALPQEDSL